MIPCHVCAKDASLGWVVGFPPAPDSQKMGLCPDHDSEEARHEVLALWRATLGRRIVDSTASPNADRAIESLVTVLFIHGGKLSFLCLQCSPTAHGTLELIEKNGNSTYIPLDQVKAYTVKKVSPGK